MGGWVVGTLRALSLTPTAFSHLLLCRVCSQLWMVGQAWNPTTTHALHLAHPQGPTCPHLPRNTSPHLTEPED